ncbi:MAG TPA: DUF4386 domain-containing protein [Chitinophagales bacterium]|nr:DUF4386 domain-containing protein [Chitinophagales bacterium]
MNSNTKAAETSPLIYARTGGVLYLVIIVVGLFNELFIRNELLVSGDATATANNIMASEQLWRIGFAGSIVMLMCAIPLALSMFVLLRPVSSNIALLAVFFNLVSIAIEAVSDLNIFAALFPLSGAQYLKAFEPDQLSALSYLTFRLHSSGYNISLVFFGMNCLFWGYLIYKSGYFPKIIGVLLMLCALCYVTNSFAWFLAPEFAAMLIPGILVPCLIAELSLCLWLMVKGVNVSKWKMQVNKSLAELV